MTPHTIDLRLLEQMVNPKREPLAVAAMQHPVAWRRIPSRQTVTLQFANVRVLMVVEPGLYPEACVAHVAELAGVDLETFADTVGDHVWTPTERKLLRLRKAL